MGDCNIDLYQETTKAKSLLAWADDHCLAPYTPDAPTSRRYDRIIDYASAGGFHVDIQIFPGNTTSDHTPVISILPFKTRKSSMGKNTHWKVLRVRVRVRGTTTI